VQLRLRHRIPYDFDLLRASFRFHFQHVVCLALSLPLRPNCSRSAASISPVQLSARRFFIFRFFDQEIQSKMICFVFLNQCPVGTSQSSFLNKNEVAERVMESVKRFPKVDAKKVSASASFSNDLGLDSLDQVELVMALEDEFKVEIPDADVRSELRQIIHFTSSANVPMLVLILIRFFQIDRLKRSSPSQTPSLICRLTRLLSKFLSHKPSSNISKASFVLINSAILLEVPGSCH
jgi:acyl carrier protein